MEDFHGWFVNFPSPCILVFSLGCFFYFFASVLTFQVIHGFKLMQKGEDTKPSTAPCLVDHGMDPLHNSLPGPFTREYS